MKMAVFSSTPPLSNYLLAKIVSHKGSSTSLYNPKHLLIMNYHGKFEVHLSHEGAYMEIAFFQFHKLIYRMQPDPQLF